jgi:succinate dehydrogenase assembly factor 2
MIVRLCQSALLPTARRLRLPAALPTRHRLLTQSSLSALNNNNKTDCPSSSSIQSRSYMGGAGEMISRRDKAGEDAIAKREQELWDKAQPRYDEIMERHLRLPAEDGELDVRKKRLIYRSKQRGWLEVDLLLGTWAAENVEKLSVNELDEFEKFVNLETIDIYNVLTLRTDVPEEMKCAGEEKSLVEKIQDWARESPLGKADMERYLEVKTKNNLI